MRKSRMVSKEEGQSLVLILIVLVIGAVIAFAIAARTISDLRRVSVERLSAQAGSQVEAMLDLVVSPSVWDEIIDEDGSWAGKCDPGTYPERIKGDNICVFNDRAVRDLMGDKGNADNPDEDNEVLCDYPDGAGQGGAEIQIRFPVNVEDYNLKKDKVVEYNLSQDETPGSFKFSWTRTGPKTPNLLVKVYSDDGSGGIELKDDHYYAFKNTDNPAFPSWGVGVTRDEWVTVNTGNDAKFVRIRAIGGGASISLKELGIQEGAIRASCYNEGVFLEFVRRVPRFDSVPECFDYVLFDGNTKIDEFGE